MSFHWTLRHYLDALAADPPGDPPRPPVSARGDTDEAVWPRRLGGCDASWFRDHGALRASGPPPVERR